MRSIARIFAGAHQVAQGLDLGGGHPDRLEQATRQKLRQAPGITPIGLYPVTGASGDEARGDHLAVDAPHP